MADSEVLVDTKEIGNLVGGLKSSRFNHILVNMALSIDELRTKANELREKGLNTQQIADELSIPELT